MTKSVFHDYVYQRLINRCQELRSYKLTTAEFTKVLYNSHVPKENHPEFIKELISLGIVKERNQMNVVIAKVKEIDWF